MVAPFDYTSAFGQQGGPLGGLMQGLKLGATMQDIEVQRAQQVAAAEAARVKAEQQRLTQEALARFLQKPFNQVTPGDIAPLTGVLPAESLKVLTDLVGKQSDAQNANTARNYGQMLSAVKSGNVAVAKTLAEELATAETNPSLKRGYTLLAQGFDKAPDAAAKQIALTMQELGGEYSKFATKVLEMEGVKPGRTISSAADKVAAGITDAEGKPLSGTFFVEPGKEPKLVTGAKPGFTILTPQEAAQRGLPTQGYTWQINRETNDISSLVKPSQAAVQVNIPGQPTPPTKLEEEIDKKFAPLAVEWMSGEKSRAASRINQLKAVTNVLESGKRITGPVVGLTPDVVLSFVNPGSREARANAERVIQEGLRATLGAQFTKVEGENFLARAYDPKAPQADNVRRLRSIVTQMEESAKDRESMMKYMQGPGKGSLQGYTGRVPTIDDFYAAIEVQTPAAPAAAPAATARSQAVDAALQKYKTKSGGQ
jgi:autotransporter adhesin